jgi:hypothetical protein
MPLVPNLQTRYDENGIPVSAKCSLCGEQMPQSTPRITDPIANVEWFTVLVNPTQILAKGGQQVTFRL